jgi:predicted nucleotidyltransferase
LGRISISGEVFNDEYWWTTPSRVQIADVSIQNSNMLIPDIHDLIKKYSLKITDVHQIISLRGRFTENVRLLERFYVSGSLELVIPIEKEPYMQISLGTSPEDYFYLQ